MDTGTTYQGEQKEARAGNDEQGKHSPLIKKNECKPWLKKMWCIAEITPQYRQRMYRLLDLYAEAYDPNRPVICMDEKSKQLLEAIRKPIAMKPGRAAKYDYEYKRNGTRNIFVAVEPKAGHRIICVTNTRNKTDFSCFIREIVNSTAYEQAVEIRIVLDNLNTHFEKSLYDTFSKAEADRILRRITFIYTPKHASWLNMAEIEINVMQRECLGDKIGSEQVLKKRLHPWTAQRNAEKKKINWTFTRQDADAKLSGHYVA